MELIEQESGYYTSTFWNSSKDKYCNAEENSNDLKDKIFKATLTSIETIISDDFDMKMIELEKHVNLFCSIKNVPQYQKFEDGFNLIR